MKRNNKDSQNLVIPVFFSHNVIIYIILIIGNDVDEGCTGPVMSLTSLVYKLALAFSPPSKPKERAHL